MPSAKSTDIPFVRGSVESTLFSDENINFLKHNPDSYAMMSKSRFANSIQKAKTVIQPTDDFYTHVNSKWLRDELIELEKHPKYYVKDDDFRAVQDKVYYEIIDLIETQPGKNISNLLASLRCSNTNRLREHAREVDRIFDQFVATGNMYDCLAYVSSNPIVAHASPISWSSIPDEKNVSKLVTHLYPAQLTVEEYGIYTDNPDDSADIEKWKNLTRKKYRQYIGHVFSAMDPDSEITPAQRARDVWSVEIEIAEAGGCDEVPEPNMDFYNPMSADTLNRDLGFDLKEFSRKLGFARPIGRAIVGSLNSIKCLARLISENWSTPRWISYWRYVFYKQMIRFDDTYRNIHYEFFDRYIAGQSMRMPREIYPMFGLSFAYNRLITDLYYESNHDDTTHKYVASMAGDIRRILIAKIGRSKWLNPKTKKIAAQKIEKLTFLIGKPESVDSDPRIAYTANDPWGNMVQCAEAKHRGAILAEGKRPGDTPDIDWHIFKLIGTQCYMVNAYYRPTLNSIYIPVAYIQKPFIDLDERGAEYNLAGVGYTIGHELCHALDDMGSQFDANGNMNDWWTRGDKRAFKKHCGDVIRQYEAAARRDGLEFDATDSIGEDLADIGGLSLIEEYLFTFLIVNQTSPITQRLIFKELYVNLAVQSRQAIQQKAIRAEMRNNPHPLEKYRCNCPLARSKIFRILFDIPKQSPMWWNNTNQLW
jgi:predicted metalloendopeptidase